MQIITIIRELVDDIVFLDSGFKKTFQTGDVLRAIREKKIPKEGRIGYVKYYFHGIGCRAVFPDRVVNFDYTPPSICGGFSEHDLLDYIKSRGIEIPEEVIKKELKKLEYAKEIFYPKISPNQYLFFTKNYRPIIDKYF